MAKIGRREFLLGAVGIGVGLALAELESGCSAGPEGEPSKWRRLEIEELKQEIETSRTGEIIQRLTSGHDYLRGFVGEQLSAKCLDSEDFTPYAKLFTTDELVNKQGPQRGHHTPRFWLTLYQSVEKVSPAASNFLSELIDRLNQHAVYFGSQGDAIVRMNRQTQLLITNGISPATTSTIHKATWLELLQVRTERDVGKFAKSLNQAIPDLTVREPLLAQANEAIQAWVDTGLPILTRTGIVVDSDELRSIALQSNPFYLSL